MKETNPLKVLANRMLGIKNPEEVRDISKVVYVPSGSMKVLQSKPTVKKWKRVAHRKSGAGTVR